MVVLDFVKLAPTPAWVLLRRLRYTYARLFGCSKLANEDIHIPWRRDWDVIHAIKQVARTPPHRKQTGIDCELWDTLMGEFWAPIGVSASFMTMLTIEVMSDTYHFAAQNWSTPPIVIDCGANIGMFSRMALDRGAAQVISCEPSPKTAHCLRLTFARDIQANRLTVLPKAVWKKSERLQFSTASDTNPGAHQIASGAVRGNVEVEATSIDCIVKEHGLPRVDFIKMDIEGAELHALHGATETIQKFRPFLGLGTEHTSDIAVNNESVIRCVHQIDPTYRLLCTEVHAEQSGSFGLVLAPYSLFFY